MRIGIAVVTIPLIEYTVMSLISRNSVNKLVGNSFSTFGRTSEVPINHIGMMFKRTGIVLIRKGTD